MTKQNRQADDLQKTGLLTLAAETRLAIYQHLSKADLIQLGRCCSKLSNDTQPLILAASTLELPRLRHENGERTDHYSYALRIISQIPKLGRPLIRAVTLYTPYEPFNHVNYDRAFEAFNAVKRTLTDNARHLDHFTIVIQRPHDPRVRVKIQEELDFRHSYKSFFPFLGRGGSQGVPDCTKLLAYFGPFQSARGFRAEAIEMRRPLCFHLWLEDEAPERVLEMKVLRVSNSGMTRDPYEQQRFRTLRSLCERCTGDLSRGAQPMWVIHG